MDSQRYFQVGVNCEHPSVGPLSLRERAGVRVAFDLGLQQKTATPRSPFCIALKPYAALNNLCGSITNFFGTPASNSPYPSDATGVVQEQPKAAVF